MERSVERVSPDTYVKCKVARHRRSQAERQARTNCGRSGQTQFYGKHVVFAVPTRRRSAVLLLWGRARKLSYTDMLEAFDALDSSGTRTFSGYGVELLWSIFNV